MANLGKKFFLVLFFLCTARSALAVALDVLHYNSNQAYLQVPAGITNNVGYAAKDFALKRAHQLALQGHYAEALEYLAVLDGTVFDNDAEVQSLKLDLTQNDAGEEDEEDLDDSDIDMTE